MDRALVETPRAAPAAIQDGLVVLGPVVASAGSEGGSVRVADSVQSLLVSWTPPADARGAPPPVTGYLVEWWTTPAAVAEEQTRRRSRAAFNSGSRGK
jgi:hypothetical protein